MSLHWSFVVLAKVCKLPGQNALHGVLVLVSVVRDVDRGAARADPVGADWAGVPGSEARDVRPLAAGGLGAALYVGGDVLRDVEQHHVVAWRGIR